MEDSSTGSIDSRTIVSKDVASQDAIRVDGFFKAMGTKRSVPQHCNYKDFYSDFVRGLIDVISVERGRISCCFSIKPPIVNFFGGTHGGAVASVAEMLSTACAQTVVGKDKEFFLGELSTSYLSAASKNAEVIADASVVRNGRNLTVITIEFRLNDSGKLVYISRATFYTLPGSSL